MYVFASNAKSGGKIVMVEPVAARFVAEQDARDIVLNHHHQAGTFGTGAREQTCTANLIACWCNAFLITADRL